MQTSTIVWVVSLVLLISCTGGVGGACKDFPIVTYPIINTIKNTTSMANNGVPAKIFNLGTVGSFGTGGSLGMTRFMVEQINNNMSILPDIMIQLTYADTLKSKANALLATQSLLNNVNATALIGGTYADETQTSQLVASVYGIPQISALPIGAAMSNKGQYPFLARVNPPDNYQAAAMASLMRLYDWKQAFVAYTDDDYGVPGFQNLQNAVKDDNVSLYSTVIHIPATDYTQYVQYFQEVITKHNVRIFLMYTQSSIDGINMMKALKDAGLVGPETGNTYIMMYSITYTFLGTPGTYNTSANGYPFMVGAVGLVTRGAIASPLLSTLNTSWNSAEYNSTFYKGTRPNPGSFWYFVDAVLTYVYALDALLKQGVDFYRINGTMLMNQVIKSNFSGVTGQVYFDRNYDRVGDYVWYNYGEFESNSFSNPIAIYSATTNQTTFVDDDRLNFYGNQNPVDGRTLPVYKTLIPGLSIALGVIIGLAAIVAVFASVMLYAFWNNFKTHGSFYCGVMIVGVYVGYAAALVLLPEQTDGLCMLFPWLLGIGFTLVYGCLFIKTWTLYRVHRKAEQMKRSTLTPLYIIKGIGLYLTVEVIILIVWTIVDRPTAYYNKMVDGTYVKSCTTQPTFWAIFAGVKASWLCFGAILSILTRHVAAEYSESKSIAYATYNIFALLVIAIPLSIVLNNVPGGSMIIEVGIIVVALTFTMCSLFFGIWMRILFPGKDLPSICTPTPNRSGSSSTQSQSGKPSSGSTSMSASEQVVRI